jgi:hypothetical protein
VVFHKFQSHTRRLPVRATRFAACAVSQPTHAAPFFNSRESSPCARTRGLFCAKVPIRPTERLLACLPCPYLGVTPVSSFGCSEAWRGTVTFRHEVCLFSVIRCVARGAVRHGMRTIAHGLSEARSSWPLHGKSPLPKSIYPGALAVSNGATKQSRVCVNQQSDLGSKKLGRAMFVLGQLSTCSHVPALLRSATYTSFKCRRSDRPAAPRRNPGSYRWFSLVSGKGLALLELLLKD